MKKMNLKVLATAALIALIGVGTTGCGQDNPDGSDSEIVIPSGYTLTIDQADPSVAQGKTIQLTATVTPDQTPVSWSSSNEAIATVSETGLVTGMAIGQCKIRATVGNSLTKEVTLTVTDPDATVAGRIVVDYDNLPQEFQAGEANALDLDQYVKVTKVSKWSVTTESENITISGHKIIGVGYGPFTATIVAGTTKRAISGSIISDKKVAFNQFISSISDNFESYSAYSGLNMYAENYWLSLSDIDEESGKYIFSGSINHPSNGRTYSFSINATASDNNMAFDSSITVDPGYAASKTQAGITGFSTLASSFQEVIDNDVPYSGINEDGDTFYYYAIENSETGSDENSSTLLDDLYDSLGATDYWYFLSQRYGATYAFLIYFPEVGSFNLVPANQKGIISSFTSGGKSYSSAVMVDSVNQISLPAAESWLADPVIPEQIDSTPIQGFFDKMLQGKTMTLTGQGAWIDSNGASTACPDNMRFSDTGNQVFGDFSLKVAANESVIETTVLTIDKKYQYASDTGEAGSSTVNFVKDGAQYVASGTYDAEKNSYAYDKAEKVESSSDEPLTSDDLWGSTDLGGAFKKDVLSLDNGKTKTSLLAITSFKQKEENSDGSISYYFNDYGDASLFNAGNAYISGTRGLASVMLGVPGIYTQLWIGYQQWGDFVINSFTLSADGSSLTASFIFYYSSSAMYRWGWTISDLGTDNVSAQAKALLSAE